LRTEQLRKSHSEGWGIIFTVAGGKGKKEKKKGEVLFLQHAPDYQSISHLRRLLKLLYQLNTILLDVDASQRVWTH
jgi:hypothetical protein